MQKVKNLKYLKFKLNLFTKQIIAKQKTDVYNYKPCDQVTK